MPMSHYTASYGAAAVVVVLPQTILFVLKQNCENKKILRHSLLQNDYLVHCKHLVILYNASYQFLQYSS